MLVKRVMSKNVVSVSVPGNREEVLDLMRKEDKGREIGRASCRERV